MKAWRHLAQWWIPNRTRNTPNVDFLTRLLPSIFDYRNLEGATIDGVGLTHTRSGVQGPLTSRDVVGRVYLPCAGISSLGNTVCTGLAITSGQGELYRSLMQFCSSSLSSRQPVPVGAATAHRRRLTRPRGAAQALVPPSNMAAWRHVDTSQPNATFQ
ncbi:hypothetical protein Bbelb_379280 [Branchiostoma belcheri]|nr:hypothetical protein Bbelb_379280 [Branchiostoma belcheri]